MRWHIQTLEETESTQNLVKSAATVGAEEGAVFQALIQKNGQGRHGRVWESPKGNLYCSFLLRPQCPADQIGQLAILMAVSIGQAIKPLLRAPENLQLKWPNDILYDGKKLSGILLESDLSDGGAINWLAVGFGVNVENPPLKTSIALLNITKEFITPEALRDLILEKTAALYELWQAHGFEDIRKTWLEMAHSTNTTLSVQFGDETIEGQFETLDPQGYLLLAMKDGSIRRISSGDVFIEQG